MRLRCPQCQAVFAAKNNARNVKCPECGKREQAPAEGWTESPGWRKGKVGAFERLDPAGQPAGTTRAADSKNTYIIVGILALAVAGAGIWWTMNQQGDDATAASCPHTAATGPASGCPVGLDVITPGVWVVSSDSEAILAWVSNNGAAPLAYTWAMTGVGGAPLPQGWTVTFATPTGTLPPGGSGGDEWATTIINLQIPATQPAGDVQAELHAGGATRAITLQVAAQRGEVARIGQSVATEYDLKELDGTDIQKGPFCTQAGGSGAVKGYAFGLVGVAKGETVTLIVPAALHYGVEPGSQFGGRTLSWAATVTDFVSGCPR